MREGGCVRVVMMALWLLAAALSVRLLVLRSMVYIEMVARSGALEMRFAT
jgi:hypothetical protein